MVRVEVIDFRLESGHMGACGLQLLNGRSTKDPSVCYMENGLQK